MTAGMIALFFLATAISSHAQTFASLFSFDGVDGSAPNGPLVQGFDGNFYQTTNNGGQSSTCGYKVGCGTVFQITAEGKLTTIYNFCSQANCADGSSPDTMLSLGKNGNFYGATYYGGAHNNEKLCNGAGCGTVFEITPGGKLTTLYSFCAQSRCTDGINSEGVIQAANGNLYGTAFSGGANDGCGIAGCGTFFELTLTGKFTTLYNFCAQPNCADGSSPVAGVVQGTNGNFYGTTAGGGDYKEGTVFEITAAGKLTTLHSFCAQSNNGSCVDGSQPLGPLIEAADGNFYGTTYAGGNNFNGTVFSITPTGQFSTVYSFCSLAQCDDGALPASQLVQGTDRNFYGVTSAGGSDPGSFGTAFQLTPDGKLTTLYSFCAELSCADGRDPGGLTQSTDGTFYGTTGQGGRTNCRCGTMFSLPVGLGPFVAATPNFGKVGNAVNILGNGLTGTTSVRFNGETAVFTIVSDTYIKATVPPGTATGTIQVTTPTGTLSSNVAFQVLP